MPFQIRPEHVAFIRRKRMGEAFANTFAGSGLEAKPDASSGTIAVKRPGSDATPAIFSLDSEGFVGGIRTPLGREWRIDSDDQGRATGITNPGGSTAHFAYDQRGRLQQIGRDGQWLFAMQHDTANNLCQVSYADGTQETLTYQKHKYLTNISRRTRIEQAFEYDRRNYLTAIIDGKGNRTRYEYGQWNLPERAIYADGSTEEYEYDESGTLKAITRGGVKTAVKADEQGRLCEIAYTTGAKVERKYTPEGLLSSVTTAGGSGAKWEYKDGRLTREESVAGAAEYVYNEAGQIAGLVYPDGSKIAYGWDDDGRLASIKDWNSAETKWHYATGERGWVAEYAGGLRAGTSLTPAGLVQEIYVKPPMLGGGWRATYTRDAEDRVSECVDSLSGRREFAYDADGRLLQAGSQDFAYDAADNLTDGGFGKADFNAANQPAGVVGGVACSHDARGNLTLGLAEGGAWQLAWDEGNRLVEARGPSGQTVEYGYDGLGRRAWRKEGGSYTEYFWAGETQIAETEWRNGEVVRRQEYLFIPGTYTLFATRVNGEVLHAHCDPVGTPRLLTNAKGESVWAAAYDAWGKRERVWGEAIHQPWRFPGQYADATTGLHDNRFRVYNPYLGRYLSRDPLGYAGGGLNLYAYASNDPVNGADPLGLWSWSSVAVAVGSIAVGIAVTALLAPVAPFALAVIAGGMVAGALGFGLNEALNEKEFCATCIALAALKGAVIGGVAAIPFAIAGPAAGLGAIMAAGGASGGLGYVGTWALTPGMQFSWADLGKSVALGAVTAGAFKVLAPVAGKVWTGVKGAVGGDAEVAPVPKAEATPEMPSEPQPQQRPRPSWRQSEKDVGNDLGSDYSEQKSFKGGEEVPYGTKGSTRPDWYKPGESVEVKNYNLATEQGQDRLVNNVTEQAINRANELPPGTKQSLVIDTRGQNISRDTLDSLVDRISQGSNGTLAPENITILR